MPGLMTAQRQKWIGAPLFRWAASVLPPTSATEQQALEAGDVWWDAALFSSNPDWDALLATPAARLSDEEQAFLDGPVETLCRMADDWRINFAARRVSDELWGFIKAEGFLGMIIPKAYGGLGLRTRR